MLLGNIPRRTVLLSRTGLSPSMAPLIQRYSVRRLFCNLPRASYHPEGMSHNPTRTTDTTYHVRMVWADPLSLATTHGVAFCFLFLRLLRCFNSPGVTSLTYVFSQGSAGLARWGFPIRKSPDKLVSSNPGLFAGNYVLHRLSVPRHSPQAVRH